MNSSVRLVGFIVLFLPVLLLGQSDSCSSGNSFTIGAGESGISFGNAPRHNGLRINWSDCCLEEINGVNISLWKPGEPVTGSINGIAFGVVGPAAGSINGIGLGLGGVIGKGALSGLMLGGLGIVTSGDLTGIAIGGLGCVSEGAMTGISFGSLGLVGKRGLTGINVGGLGAVSDGGIYGVNIGGLGLVGKEGLIGMNFGGLGAVSGGEVIGLSIGGLALVGQQGIHGLNFGGLAVVSAGNIDFLTVAGLAVVAKDGLAGATLSGIAIVSEMDIVGLNLTLGELRSEASVVGIGFGGYRVKADRATGLHVSIARAEVQCMEGVLVGAYTRISERQEGLSIGIYNHATELFGVQLGLINIADNNPSWLRILPLINAHF